MRPLLSWFLASSLALGLPSAMGLAQEAGISPRCHPWGHFDVGAWKLVRVVTETLDENGRVASTSITETETTLTKIEPDGVTLRVQVSVEVAGKRLEREPQTVKQGFHGNQVGADVKVGEPEDAQVVIEGRKIPCQVVRLESTGPTSKTVSRIHFSNKIPPYILKREVTITAAEGDEPLSETTEQVVALDMPCDVLDETKSAALVRAYHKHPEGTAVTWAFTSAEIPGGIIRHSSKELNKVGRLARRSTLELLLYGLSPRKERTGLLGRKRPGLLRRPSMRVPAP